MKSADQDSYCKPLIGNHLTAILKLDYTWFFRFDGDVSVDTEGPWRLFDDNRMVLTSEDHGQQFGLAEPLDAVSMLQSSVVGRSVESATISASSGDLTIEFSDQSQLQMLQMSCGYESWRVNSRTGESICMGGGKIEHDPGR